MITFILRDRNITSDLGINIKVLADTQTLWRELTLLREILPGKKILNGGCGWNDILYLNDSIVLIVAAGLHAINIKNGTGWDYIAITGKKGSKRL